MSRFKRMVAVAFSAMALTVGLASQVSAAPSAPAPSAGEPAIMAPCDGRWYENGTFLTERISPWYKTSNGVDFTREIRFRAVSGVHGIRGIMQSSGNCFWQTTKVVVAGQNETKSCKGAGCSYSGWVNYNPPFHNWGAPGQVQGWDPFAHRWFNYGFA